MARISVIGEVDATGELAEIYRRLRKQRGKIANVHTIASLNPKSITAHMDLYVTLMYRESPLSRAEREMIGVVVSASNRCTYCVAHHGQALQHFWKAEDRVATLAEDYTQEPELTPRQRALCRFALLTTEKPDSDELPSAIASLRDAGLNDRGILDAALVTSYFNFVNRLVLSLGVETEANAGGYRYE